LRVRSGCLGLPLKHRTFVLGGLVTELLRLVVLGAGAVVAHHEERDDCDENDRCDDHPDDPCVVVHCSPPSVPGISGTQPERTVCAPCGSRSRTDESASGGLDDAELGAHSWGRCGLLLARLLRSDVIAVVVAAA